MAGQVKNLCKKTLTVPSKTCITSFKGRELKCNKYYKLQSNYILLGQTILFAIFTSKTYYHAIYNLFTPLPTLAYCEIG